MTTEICVEYKDIDFVIVVTNFTFTKGCDATLYEPAELPEVEIVDGYLYIDGDDFSFGTLAMPNQTLITSASLFDKVISANESRCDEEMYEVAEAEAEDHAAAYAEYKYEQRQDAILEGD